MQNGFHLDQQAYKKTVTGLPLLFGVSPGMVQAWDKRKVP